MDELTVTKENFQDEVVASDIPVLLDFWATWCGPCRMLSPIIEKIATKYKGKVKVGKVNVDEQPELSDAFHVQSIPMVVLIKQGKIAATSIGYKPQEEIEAMLK